MFEARKEAPQKELGPRKALAGAASEHVCTYISHRDETGEDVVFTVETRQGLARVPVDPDQYRWKRSGSSFK